MAKKAEPIKQIDIEGKIPPQAIDLEEAVLGAIMLDANAIEEVIPILYEECFYKDTHRKIYRAIKSLYSSNEPIDLMTVTERLRKDNILEEVGGAYFITILTSKVASSAHLGYHARILAQKYYLRELISMSTQLQNLCFSEEEVDTVMDFVSGYFDKLTNKVFGGKPVFSWRDLINESIKEYYVRDKLSREGKVSGIQTPVSKLTAFTQGWQRGDLVIIAGRPSMGKTAVVLSCLKAAAESGEKPAVFSLEMTSVRLADRILVGEADISMERFRSGNLHPDEIEKLEKAAGRILDYNVYIDDNSGVSMEYIKNRVRILKRDDKCSLVIIDYLQLVDPEKDKGKNREQEVAEISKKAKQIAKELDVPVILLAQLNRSCELRGGDKRPNISDLRESGGIEQDADLIILLYRAEYYKFLEDEEGNSTKGKGEFIVGKQRNGRTGTVFFGYNDSLTRIFDYSTDAPFSGNVTDFSAPQKDFEPNGEFDTQPF